MTDVKLKLSIDDKIAIEELVNSTVRFLEKANDKILLDEKRKQLEDMWNKKIKI